MSPTPPVSIIVPTRNEERSIDACVQRIFSVYPHAEVVVVDGGFDGTGDRCRQLAAEFPRLRYVHNANDKGKGHAVRVGIEQSTHDVIAQIDSDLQFLPEELPQLFAPIFANRADMVLGSRFAADSVRSGAAVVRSAGNLAVSAYASLLSGKKMTDVLAGMKAWRREVTRSFYLASDNYSYEVELPMKALRAGFRVVDVPVTTQPRTTGTSSVNVWRTGIRLFADITRFRMAR